MKNLIRIISLCLLVAYALLLLIHFVIKDHFWPLAVIFYALPLPFLIGMGVFMILLFIRRKKYFLSILGFVFGLTLFWLSTYYFFTDTIEIPRNAGSILFWNVADRKVIPTDILLEQLKNNNPEIIAFVEADNAAAEDIEKLSKAFPNYEFKILEGGMFVGMRGTITQDTFVIEEADHKLNYVEGTIDDRAVSLVIADIFASPIMNKERTLHIVSQFAKDHKADFVVGDFNTPYQSVHFRSFETDYTSFHDYGQGFAATWPYGIPLFELDQIFASKSLNPILLKKFHYPVSDHAMLLGYFQK